MGIFLRPAKWNFFALASSKRTFRTAKGQFREVIFSLILICWGIYIAKSLQPKKVIVLDNNDCCKGWTLNGTLEKDFSSAILAEPKPFCKVPLRVHPLPHSFLSTKRTIPVFETVEFLLHFHAEMELSNVIEFGSLLSANHALKCHFGGFQICLLIGRFLDIRVFTLEVLWHK